VIRGAMSRRVAPLGAGFIDPGHTLRDTEPWDSGDSAQDADLEVQRRQTRAAPVESNDGIGKIQSVESGILSDYTPGQGFYPIYQSRWDTEFRQQSYHPGPIRVVATVGVVNYLWGAAVAASHTYPNVLGSIFLSLQ
jgi:hypothetical protein